MFRPIQSMPGPAKEAAKLFAHCAAYFALVFGILLSLLWLNHGPANFAHDALAAALVAGPVSLLATLRT